MSLRAFHILFIAISGALCLFLVGWGFAHRGSMQGAALAGLGAAGFVGLAAYLRHFLRSGSRSSNGLHPKPAVLTFLASAMAAASEADACTVCMGQPDVGTAKAYMWGIAFLAVLVLATLSGISLMMYRAIQAHDVQPR